MSPRWPLAWPDVPVAPSPQTPPRRIRGAPAAAAARPQAQAAVRRPGSPRPPRRDEGLPERQGRARGRRPRHPGGRLRLPRRPVGRRQVDPDQAADPRRGRDARRRDPRRPGPRPAAAAAACRRSAARSGSSSRTSSSCRPKSVWENVAVRPRGDRHAAQAIRPAVDRVLALVGLTAQRAQMPEPALGRRAAADGDRPGPRPRPAPDHRRRADRQPRPADQLGDHPAPPPDQRSRRDGPHGDPQRRRRDRPPQARRRARGGPGHPRRGRWHLPPGRLSSDLGFVVFSLRRAWQGFWRNALMSLAATATMVLMLLLLAGFWILQTGLQAGLDFTESKVEVVADLKDNTKLDEIKAISAASSRCPRSTRSHYVSKEEALAEYCAIARRAGRGGPHAVPRRESAPRQPRGQARRGGACSATSSRASPSGTARSRR